MVLILHSIINIAKLPRGYMADKNQKVIHEKRPKEHRVIHALSERIVKAQKPIRILDAIKWDPSVKETFFRSKFQKLPKLNPDDYSRLRYKPDHVREEFYGIERDIKRKLGEFSGAGNIMIRMCREYRTVTRMLEARGTATFSRISQQLYGSTYDVFYPGGPTLFDLGEILFNALYTLEDIYTPHLDDKKYTAKQAVEILRSRLSQFFAADGDRISVVLDDGIISDAAAGADKLKLRKQSMFSERDINVLEVHEGWVHIATTLNGLSQPICTFLSKGPPSSTIYQEGLAVLMELITFSSHPKRIKRLTHRIMGTNLAEQGATFIDVFRFFQEQGLDNEESYTIASRIYRGSTATLGPFTKDLCYSKGFILIYNYLRLAIQHNKIKRIPLLFLGKASLEDLYIYEQLIEENIVTEPKHLPSHFKDLAAISCWMSYSLFLNKIDLDKLAKNLFTIL